MAAQYEFLSLLFQKVGRANKKSWVINCEFKMKKHFLLKSALLPVLVPSIAYNIGICPYKVNPSET